MKKTITILVILLSILVLLGTSLREKRGARETLRGAKILVIIAPGFSEDEYSSVETYLRSKGAEIFLAYYEPTPIKSDEGYLYTPDFTLGTLDPSEFHLIYIPGGGNPRALLKDERREQLFNFLREAKEGNVVIAAVCHGPLVLIEADILDGLEATGHPSIMGLLREAGARVSDNMVVVDDGVITAQYSVLEFREKLAQILREKLGE